LAGYRLGDFDLGSRDKNLADIGLNRPIPDLNDHRQAVDVGEGLSRKPCGGHPGGDHHYGILVFDHGLRDGRGKLCNGPYTYCGQIEKQLVSAPDRWLKGFDPFMNSFEFNKMAGAVLGTALMVFGLNELSGIIYHPEKPEKPGFAIEVAEAGTGGEAQGGEAQPAVSLGTLLASADAAKGQAAAKACVACHDFTKGGPNKTGPNLWDVVMRNHGSHGGFNYSDGMKAKSAEPWTYEALYAFLKSPKDAIPGTKMTLAVKKDQDRANILAYLATLSDSPKPFPAP
jgi:cytochrome c